MKARLQGLRASLVTRRGGPISNGMRACPRMLREIRPGSIEQLTRDGRVITSTRDEHVCTDETTRRRRHTSIERQRSAQHRRSDIPLWTQQKDSTRERGSCAETDDTTSRSTRLTGSRQVSTTASCRRTIAQQRTSRSDHLSRTEHARTRRPGSSGAREPMRPCPLRSRPHPCKSTISGASPSSVPPHVTVVPTSCGNAGSPFLDETSVSQHVLSAQNRGSVIRQGAPTSPRRTSRDGRRAEPHLWNATRRLSERLEVAVPQVASLQARSNPVSHDRDVNAREYMDGRRPRLRAARASARRDLE